MEALFLTTVGLVAMLLIINIVLLIYSINQKLMDGIIYAAFTDLVCAAMLYFIWVVFPLIK